MKWVRLFEPIQSLFQTLTNFDEFLFVEETGDEDDDDGSDEVLLFCIFGGDGRQSLPPAICFGESPQ